MSGFDYIRLFASLLAFANIIMLVPRLWEMWPKFVAGQKLLFVYISGMTVVSVWSGFDLIFLNAPSTFRHVFVLLANFALFVYLFEPSRKWYSRLGVDPLFRNPSP